VQALPKLTAHHQTKLMLFKATHDCDWSAIWRDKFLVFFFFFFLFFFFFFFFFFSFLFSSCLSLLCHIVKV
jgi:hypothetical protein